MVDICILNFSRPVGYLRNFVTEEDLAAIREEKAFCPTAT